MTLCMWLCLGLESEDVFGKVGGLETCNDNPFDISVVGGLETCNSPDIRFDISVVGFLDPKQRGIWQPKGLGSEMWSF